jgi:hypothetical protein
VSWHNHLLTSALAVTLIFFSCSSMTSLILFMNSVNKLTEIGPRIKNVLTDPLYNVVVIRDVWLVGIMISVLAS